MVQHPKKYIGIADWGHMMQSYKYYIDEQQLEASADGAPLDAIYKNHFGIWVTVRDLAPNHDFRVKFYRDHPSMLEYRQ